MSCLVWTNTLFAGCDPRIDESVLRALWIELPASRWNRAALAFDGGQATLELDQREENGVAACIAVRRAASRDRGVWGTPRPYAA